MKIEEILEGITIQDVDWTEVFDVLEVIGKGNYGVVVKGRFKASGETVAIKQTLLEETIDVESGAREIRVLESCHHPNIVSYYGTYRSSAALLVVMELCDGGSIDAVRKILKRKFSEPIIAYILHETLCGLRYLHKEKKIHRDIKTGNILMNSKGEIKLVDFGITAQLHHTLSRRNSFWGTMVYMAPEVLLETDYDEKADIWSLGITLLEIAEGKLPFARLGHYPLLTRLTRKPPPTLQRPHRFSSALQSFIRRCLWPDKYTRPSAAALLEDPFLCHRDYDALRKEFAVIVQETIDRREALGGFDVDATDDDDEDEDDEEDDEESNEPVGTFLMQKDRKFSSFPHPQRMDKKRSKEVGEEREKGMDKKSVGVAEGGSVNGMKHSDQSEASPYGLLPLLSTEDWSMDAIHFASEFPSAMPETSLIAILTSQPLPPSSASNIDDHLSSSGRCHSSHHHNHPHHRRCSCSFSSSSSSSCPSASASISSCSCGFRSHSASAGSVALLSSSPSPAGGRGGKRIGDEGESHELGEQSKRVGLERKRNDGKASGKRRRMKLGGFEYSPPEPILHTTKTFQHLYAYFLQVPSIRSLKKTEVTASLEARSKMEDILGSMYHVCPTVKP